MVKVSEKNTEIMSSKKEILNDYKLAVESREDSYIGRKEVFMGKAKFGIFGDGKELPQIAMAKVFKNGDFRSGYYRDQTFMMAIGEMTSQQFFAQLYAHTSVEDEPASAGRMMNGHFGTRSIDENGEWKDLTKMKNSSSDISCTAGQMPRLLGLAYASKLYRNNPALKKFKQFSVNGNEIAFGTIGNASTSEGHFFEAMNAAGVLQVPMVMAVWDDEYGISVPKEFHTTKGSISKALAGLQRTAEENGFEILTTRGWDYVDLCKTFEKAEKIARNEHVPVLVHVEEVTQPQGHSTSGSHERYKSKERLEWEAKFDCIKKMREWILNEKLASGKELDAIEEEAKQLAKTARMDAWRAYTSAIDTDVASLISMIETVAEKSAEKTKLISIAKNLKEGLNINKLELTKGAKKALRLTRNESSRSRDMLIHWLKKNDEKRFDEYSSHLHSQSKYSAIKVGEIAAKYSDQSKMVDGREVLQACFDEALNQNPLVFALGEDVGKIGDVNQGFAGLQEKYGEIRVTDTGIRETSIIGQGIGAALRGLRPIAEIQYLDYLLYAVQTLSDDLATLQYRTKGGQKAPLIIRSRGHRLEGVWHSGSPMGMIINALRGIFVLTPRNMTQAAGMYNTLLESDDTALMIECLNGYRLKERMPDNVGEFKVPLGIPEIIREGKDVTVVTYGSMCRIVMEAAVELANYGIEIEVIDVQTLLPFDRHQSIISSIKKTNRLIVADEDVPGGASAYILEKLVVEQECFRYLDSQPVTVAAKEHRPAYGSDGDYYSKPSAETIFDKVYEMMAEVDPESFPDIY
ncbi:Pyruvate/2-oxoglutarate/acetoin dehydrogenase complex, dehydrogenase (E1) component [Reichenbachiella faecimaris]|uniref:3-methyl-2-oxobutanoate dehydrogenase (2-methylpropanoyl-transferring) n=2 Tax=Reichenbachiella faecimaris TaxID=692418 RepID=A0A1W2G659_REIFA|nr:Pyruvate/2-oxoglutarate/acetoin dehydrogenase complex, dehydrogenase (E1) component [Reichenbachiella faecimaris]